MVSDDNKNRIRFLRFGVPVLDELISGPFERNGGGVEIPIATAGGAEATSVCIMGPDGTGKSVLAMHMAAYYAADAHHANPRGIAPRILYVSTDLKKGKALEVWRNFGLNVPEVRSQFIEDPSRCSNRLWQNRKSLHVELRCFAARAASSRFKNGVAPDSTLSEYLFLAHRKTASQKNSSDKAGDDRARSTVAFVNLASESSGDDWTFLNRVLAAMKPPAPNAPRHLLIIDAIEGFETLVGKVDGFGEKRSRRSRIAQIMRAAEDKFHIVMVVEEPKANSRLPEEFVTDVVLRLRVTQTASGGRTYARRSLEIEKARAQPHVRGQHFFVFRDGRGTSAGGEVNYADDQTVTRGGRTDYLAYILVYPSLNYLSYQREQKAKRLERALVLRPPWCAGFGIPHLDDMLRTAGPKPPSRLKGQFDLQGLPVGTCTTLLGENGTYKQELAMAFLSRCFAVEGRQQVAVCIGLLSDDREAIVEEIKNRLSVSRTLHKKKLDGDLNDRFIYRRLRVHDTPSAILFHIITQTIEAAKKTLQKSGLGGQTWRIRVVFTNLTTMRAAFSDVEQDSLFLPALAFYLARQGVTALIVATEPGSPDSDQKSTFSRELRSLVDHHLYTWHVPFYGHNRVAISAVPPIAADRAASVREIRRNPSTASSLEVDPHFEMYTGLYEDTQPQLIPLKVRMFGSGTSFDNYLQHLNARFIDLFSQPENGAIVSANKTEEYEDLRAFNYFQGDTRLNHTLVMQVDEFWSKDESRLLDVYDDYLNARTCIEQKADRANDPYRIFQPTAVTGVPAADRLDSLRANAVEARRKDLFNLKLLCYPIPEKGSGLRPEYLRDRVPYMWDFGFLLLRESAWVAAKDCQLALDYTREIRRGRTTTQPLTKVSGIWVRLLQTDGGNPNPVSWREFLHACMTVARNEASRAAKQPYAFDVDLLAPESFSCLVLEVWASEAASLLGPANPFGRRLTQKQTLPGQSLAKLLEQEGLVEALFRAWLLLAEVFSPAQFGAEHVTFKPRAAQNDAIASRQWYSTACPFIEDRGTQDPLRPARLPGRYSTRGDWFLAVAGGSRSQRLGHRAIDLLSSRRANVIRLQDGLGLPTRDFVASRKTANNVWTRLYHVGEFGSKEWMKYGDLLALGPNEKNNGFDWLWRSSFANYDRQSRIWLKFQFRILMSWQTYMLADSESQKWRSGFELYDKLTNELVEARNLPSFKKFRRECKDWTEGLWQSTIG